MRLAVGMTRQEVMNGFFEKEYFMRNFMKKISYTLAGTGILLTAVPVMAEPAENVPVEQCCAVADQSLIHIYEHTILGMISLSPGSV